MNAGALGIEIVISGKVPSSRATSWRFYKGYLKKSGDLALTAIKSAQATAYLKTGCVGVKVSIMPADIKSPDKIQILKDVKETKQEVKE